MLVLHCDNCRKEIPKKMVHILGKKHEVYDTGKVDMFSNYNIAFCKQCALEFENELLKAKISLLTL